jgi:hypothetical protein
MDQTRAVNPAWLETELIIVVKLELNSIGLT